MRGEFENCRLPTEGRVLKFVILKYLNQQTKTIIINALNFNLFKTEHNFQYPPNFRGYSSKSSDPKMFLAGIGSTNLES